MDDRFGLGSIINCLDDPDEQHREGSYLTCRWNIVSTPSESWCIQKVEKLSVLEQARLWIDLFDLDETIKLDAKRLIWDLKFSSLEEHNFFSPLVLALCSLKLAYDIHNKDLFEHLNGILDVIKKNDKKYLFGKKLNQEFNSNNFKFRIRHRSEDLVKIIGQEKIDLIKRMWGDIDEAALYDRQ